MLRGKVDEVARWEVRAQDFESQLRECSTAAQQLCRENEELREGLRRANKRAESLEELLEGYKVEKGRGRAEMERQWGEMTQFY
jgi:chromosome segregation ATPase